MCVNVCTLGLSEVRDRKAAQHRQKERVSRNCPKGGIIISFGDQDYNSFGDQREQGRKEEKGREGPNRW